MSEGLRIRIQLLGMRMAQNVRIFANFGEIFGFFGLTGAEQAHAYHRREDSMIEFHDRAASCHVDPRP